MAVEKNVLSKCDIVDFRLKKATRDFPWLPILTNFPAMSLGLRGVKGDPDEMSTERFYPRGVDRAYQFPYPLVFSVPIRKEIVTENSWNTTAI